MMLEMPTWLNRELTECADRQTNWPTEIASLSRHYADSLLKKGLPTRKDERWKYTDLSWIVDAPIRAEERAKCESRSMSDINNGFVSQLSDTNRICITLINGQYFPSHSDYLERLPSNVIITSLQTANREYPDLLKQYWPDHQDRLIYEQHPFAAYNAAVFTDGLFFYLPDRCQIDLPIHLLSIVTDESFIMHPRHLFILGKNSKLTLLEEYRSLSKRSYFMNMVTHIYLDDHAQLNHSKLQQEHIDAIHFAHTTVQQQHDSIASLNYFSNGGLFARDDVIVQLQAPGATCKTNGFYRLNRDNQYVDYHIDIQHQAPHTQSEMAYKGILDKKSRAVFNGRLYVEKNAQKTTAYQSNHNLLLSTQAEMNSKPELEIHADDVKCKHGATIGQLDQDALFYLCSRGIDRQDAIDILLQGFAKDILQCINSPAIYHHIEAKVNL